MYNTSSQTLLSREADRGTVSISTVNSNGRSTTGSERSLQMALAAARIAAENRGRNILVLDLRAITPIFDYFVVVTGTSRRQLHAMSEEIDHLLEVDMHDKRLGIEGYRESRWIVLDYGNIVVHLFDEETRDYYALEELWGDAPKVPLPELNGQAAKEIHDDVVHNHVAHNNVVHEDESVVASSDLDDAESLDDDFEAAEDE